MNNLLVNNIYHGFKLKEIKKIKEIATEAFLFQHEITGARLLFLENEDDNKVFSISFRTPPADNTGVAHIVEHSVLCGSRKFNLKEPFVELVKGSLNTFLNAMTFPDKTMYPVASRNDKDFQNLMDVYLDAVFFPNIYKYPEILMQEGWHYEIEDKADELTYKGVVYNEMKGVFSSPESILDSKIFSSLFPNSTYGFESGGDPDEIIDLTNEQFLEFHAKYYHPSNSYIYLYGKMDILEKLQFLNTEYLSNFTPLSVNSAIDKQELFTECVEKNDYYPVSTNEELHDKTFLSLNYIVGDIKEAEEMLAFQILEHLLLKTQAAPLKKALVDAQLGKDVLSMFNNDILQPTFSIILNGSNKDKKADFIKVITETLNKLVENGIDKKLIEASISLLEFKLREADFGHSPKGLIYNIKCMTSWLYDQDPFMYLEYETILNTIKNEKDNNYFENLIKNKILNNSHKTLVILEPKKGLAEEKEAEIKAQLEAVKKDLSVEQIDKLILQTAQLKERQEQPDTPESLASIPLLEISDINKDSEKLVFQEKNEAETKVLLHNLNTNKIAYLSLYFDAGVLPENLIHYTYLFSELLGKVDTVNYKYADLANEININTGGIGFDLYAYSKDENYSEYYPKFKIKAKALIEKIPSLTNLLTEIMHNSLFVNKKRIKELVDQIKASMEMSLIRNAQQVAASRVTAYFSDSAKYNELGSLSFYEFINNFSKNFDDEFNMLQERFVEVKEYIFNKNNLLTSITLTEAEYNEFVVHYKNLVKSLNNQPFEQQKYNFSLVKLNEGLMTSGKVQYVAKGANFMKLGYHYTGSLKVLETILRYDYFWNKIRVQGGAYGAFTHFRTNGNMVFGSYRDPNLTETIDVYNETANYLRNFAVSEREMTKYIIGTISGVDSPLTPQMKGALATECYISNVNDIKIQQERAEILQTNQDTIKGLADLIEAAMQENYLCVVGSESKITQHKEVFGQTKHLI